MKIRILVLPVITILFALSLVITAGCQFLTTSPKTATTTVAGNTTSIYTTHVTIPVASGTAQPLPSIADVVAEHYDDGEDPGLQSKSRLFVGHARVSRPNPRALAPGP